MKLFFPLSFFLLSKTFSCKYDLPYLFRAIDNNNSSVIQHYIDSNEDLNKRNRYDGMTLLMKAACWSKENRLQKTEASGKCILELLLKNGAKTALKDNDGWTAYDYAKYFQLEDNMALLAAHGAS